MLTRQASPVAPASSPCGSFASQAKAWQHLEDTAWPLCYNVFLCSAAG